MNQVPWEYICGKLLFPYYSMNGREEVKEENGGENGDHGATN